MLRRICFVTTLFALILVITIDVTLDISGHDPMPDRYHTILVVAIGTGFGISAQRYHHRQQLERWYEMGYRAGREDRDSVTRIR
jgi:hypothetical protein